MANSLNTTFDFDVWIEVNGLCGIKNLFIKHNLTTVNKLSVTSIEFRNLMSDNELMQKSHLAPKVFTAVSNLQVLQQNTSVSLNKTIIISEQESNVINTIKSNTRILYKLEKEINNISKKYPESVSKLNARKKDKVEMAKQKGNESFDKIEDILRVKRINTMQKLEALKSSNDFKQNEDVSVQQLANTLQKWKQHLEKQLKFCQQLIQESNSTDLINEQRKGKILQIGNQVRTQFNRTNNELTKNINMMKEKIEQNIIAIPDIDFILNQNKFSAIIDGINNIGEIRNTLECKENIEYEIGDRVLIKPNKKGQIEWIGKSKEFGPGIYFGVKLTEMKGNCDGTWKGKRFFNCEYGFGIYVRLKDFVTTNDDVLEWVRSLNLSTKWLEIVSTAIKNNKCAGKDIIQLKSKKSIAELLNVENPMLCSRIWKHLKALHSDNISKGIGRIAEWSNNRVVFWIQSIGLPQKWKDKIVNAVKIAQCVGRDLMKMKGPDDVADLLYVRNPMLCGRVFQALQKLKGDDGMGHWNNKQQMNRDSRFGVQLLIGEKCLQLSQLVISNNVVNHVKAIYKQEGHIEKNIDDILFYSHNKLLPGNKRLNEVGIVDERHLITVAFQV